MSNPATNPATNPAATRTELERSFLAALCPLREKLRRCFDHQLTSFGLSRSLAVPLIHIWRADGIRQHELAEQIDIEGPSLVRLLDQLSGNGLVVRRPDPADQRVRTLHLTAAGKTLARRIMPVLERLRTDLLADAPTSDLEACLRTFGAFLDSCEQRASDVTK